MEQAQLAFQTLFSNQTLLQDPEQYFRSVFQQQINFLYNSINLLFSGRLNKKTADLVAVALKGLVTLHWHSVFVSEVERGQIRSLLEKEFMQTKNVEGKSAGNEFIAILLSEIANIEGFELIQPIVANWTAKLESEDSYDKSVEFVDVLLRVLEKADDRSYVLVPHILDVAYAVFTSAEANLSARYKALALVYLCFRSLNWCDSSSPGMLQQAIGKTVGLWTGVFVSVLSSSDRSFGVLKYYTIKALTEIFRDIPSVAVEMVATIYPQIWKALLSSTKAYLELLVFNDQAKQISDSAQLFANKSDKREQIKRSMHFSMAQQDDFAKMGYETEETCHFGSVIEAVLVSFCDLLISLTGFQGLTSETKSTLPVAIWVLGHLILMPMGDQIAWVVEPNQYIGDDDDECSQTSLKQAALSAVSFMVEKQGSFATQLLIQLIELFVQGESVQFKEQLSQAADLFTRHKVDLKSLGFDFLTWTPSPSFEFMKGALAWKYEEAGLMLLGSFIQDIVGLLSQNSNFDENEFASKMVHVLKRSSHIIVVGRSLWALNSLCYLPHIDEGLLLQVFFLLGEHLDPKYPLGVRFSASKAMTVLGYKLAAKKVRENFKGFLGDSLKSYFKLALDLAGAADENTLGLTLDNMLSFYDINPEAIAPLITTEVVTFLLKSLGQHFEHVIISNGITELSNRFLTNAQISHVYMPVLAAFVIHFLESYKEELKRSDRLCKLTDLLILASLQTADFKPFACSLEPLVKIAISTPNSSLITKMSILFKNLVLRNDSLGLQAAAVNEPAKSLFMRLIVPSEADNNCVYVGNLALALYLKCSESRTPEFVTAVARKLSKVALPSTNQGIVIFFCYLFGVDFAGTLNFLANLQIDAKFGLKVLLDHWLLHQPKFIGPRTKLLTLKTLWQLLNVDSQVLQDCYVVGFKPSHKTRSPEVKFGLKVVSLMAGALAHEKKRSQKKTRKGMDAEQLVNLYRAEAEDGRMETEPEDELLPPAPDDDFEVDINMHISEEDEDNEFAQAKGHGLNKIETGSQSYLSGLLGFDDEDNDECDPSTEKDLETLGIPAQDVLSFLESALIELAARPTFAALCLQLDPAAQHAIEKLTTQSKSN